MADLAFVRIDETGLQIFQSWFESGELSAISYPTQEWFRYVRSSPGVCAYMVYEDGTPVGEFQMDVAMKQGVSVGYIALVVNPGLWNRGYGRRLLRAFLARPELSALNRVVAKVAPGNTASQHCLAVAGFVQQDIEPDEEGMLTFAYILGRNRA